MENLKFLYWIFFTQISNLFLWETKGFSFANVSNFPDIYQVVTFISFLFFTAKDFMLADSLLLNSNTIFVFLGSRQSVIFSFISLNFHFFYLFIFSNESTPLFFAVILLPFIFHSVLCWSHMLVHPYSMEVFYIEISELFLPSIVPVKKSFWMCCHWKLLWTF